MKRNNFTLPEMLTVIAVIVILAGILIPVLINARNRARSTDCAARQGQIGKIFAAALDKRDHKLISGTSGNKLWSKALLDAGLLPSLEVARCTAMEYTGDDEYSEAFGVVVAGNTDNTFDFKSNKLFRTVAPVGVPRVEVPRSSLLMGGCTTDDDGKPQAALDFSDNKLALVHSGEVNVFFIDGSVQTLTADDFKAGSFYYPSVSAAVELSKDTDDFLREQ